MEARSAGCWLVRGWPTTLGWQDANRYAAVATVAKLPVFEHPPGAPPTVLARRRRAGAVIRRRRTALAICVVALIVVLIVVLSGGSLAPVPPARASTAPASGATFAYEPTRAAAYVARATAGEANVLFTKSPGGALATAARVAAWRPQINAAVAGTNIDPALVEGLVFVESAGLADAIVAGNPANAAGLTQILPETGQSLLGMRINVSRSKQLTGQIDIASAAGRRSQVAQLEREREQVDQRFNPALELAGTVRLLELAEQQLGRADLAVTAYHMGIANLQHVLADYNGGNPIPYAQLFFDATPSRHVAAYQLLSGLGDDSSLYYWRVLGAVQVMRLYRSDRSALSRLASLEGATGSPAEVLHPPDRTTEFADPAALDSAYQSQTVVPLPSNPTALGLAYDSGMGSLAPRLGVSRALYRGLRPDALELLLQLAGLVRSLSHGTAPLIVASTVADRRYQASLGGDDAATAAGYSFTIERRYLNQAQAVAFQDVLDRLQALNVIAWQRFATLIQVTVASGAPQVLEHGP